MTLRSEIRTALGAGPKTAAQLVDLCDSASDATAMASNLWALKNEGRIKVSGTIEGRNSYIVDDWPEGTTREGRKTPRAKAAPPPKAKRAYKKRGKKASRARAAELAAEPAPIANGGDEFAITDAGLLAIKQNGSAILLHPESFARLRTFIERAEQVFNPTE